MQPQTIDYRTFMLRVWREPEIDFPVSAEAQPISQVRYTLHNTESNEQWGFASIGALHSFLDEMFPTESLQPCM